MNSPPTNSMKKLFGLQAVAFLALAGCTFPGNGGGGGVGRSQSNITPQPSACSALGENACLARTDCEARYGGVCPACAPGSACPPCSSSFLGCQDKPAPTDPCTGLNEAQCNANSLCHANYDTSCPACPIGTMCAPCPGPTFTSCSVNLPPQDPCVGLDEATCVLKEPFCQPQWAAVAMVCPPSQDGGCDMQPIYLGCHGGVRTCITNCDCAVNEYCSVKYVNTEPPEVFSEDGGIARCMSAPTPIGVCTPAPTDVPGYPIDPTDPPVEAKDAGFAP